MFRMDFSGPDHERHKAHLANIVQLSSVPIRRMLTKFPLMRSKMYRIEQFCG